MSAKNIKIRVKTQPQVVMEAEVARKIRQHSRSSMKAEVCGVLIGRADEERTVIEACIPGVNAAQGGAHVTFTQDTWEHIYKIKDQQFPDEKIVGWYHSHPGFGVFLSEHDLFIQENFFSNPHQVAWVYDPHTDEEGCFGWIDGKIEKLSGLRFGYSQSVQIDANRGDEHDREDTETGDVTEPSVHGRSAAQRRDEPAWVKWAIRVMLSFSLLAFGFVGGLLSWQISPASQPFKERFIHDEQLLQRLSDNCSQEIEACDAKVHSRASTRPLTPTDPAAGPQNPQHPSQPQQKPQPGAEKGANGKH
jgi:proteasome lid subunit RPN8/RPN11